MLIVENTKYLRNDGDTDPDGNPVALVKIKRIRPYIKSDIPAACASRWEPNYYSWELVEVRPIYSEEKILAARGIYAIEAKLSASSTPRSPDGHLTALGKTSTKP